MCSISAESSNGRLHILCALAVSLSLTSFGVYADKPESPSLALPSNSQTAPTLTALRAMWAKVDAGTWTVEEALVINLKILAGEIPAAAVYGDQPVDLTEIDTLIRTARDYVRGGSDRDTREKIQQLLDKLFIDTDRLKRQAVPDNGVSVWEPR